MANSAEDIKDPFMGLKMVAYRRNFMPEDGEPVTVEDLFNFAKWQLCVARNKLWLDPIWESYTQEELLIEYFSIVFTENKESAAEFYNKVRVVPDKTYEFFAEMERKFNLSKEKLAVDPTGSFEERFD